ncbi:hypothetical protein N752_00525 [Desulforamulus aquiferis]|nr:hypothetical protein N752_00525 [Desulforamulus aquiferis]
MGIGLGLVFRFNGTTGGTVLAAAIVRSYVGINVGQLLFLIDAIVVVWAGVVFQSVELAMYALITIFLTSWIIDRVLEAFPRPRPLSSSPVKLRLLVTPLTRNWIGVPLPGRARGCIPEWNGRLS